MRAVARGLLLALTLVSLALPGLLGATGAAFAIGTVVLFGANLALLTVARPVAAPAAAKASALVQALVAVTAAALVIAASYAWMRQLLTFPIDSMRADMLVVVGEGIRRALQGRDPYTIYHVPWEAPLPYGPVLWAPFLAPYALHADLRFVTVAGELFVAAMLAFAAVAAAWDSVADSIGWLAALAALAFSPDVRGFTSIGHTPVYWPLLVLFGWLVVRRRWHAAAFAAGLLVVARTTMIAVVPVLLIAGARGFSRADPGFSRADRGFSRAGGVLRVALLVAGTVAALYLPFAVWDWRALAYALYGSYQAVMKGYVWTATTWAHQTLGVTGLLLRAGWSRWVEAVQIAALVLTYIAAWRSIARGGEPARWCAFALFVFSATTLWPVTYVYLDVFVLLAAVAVAESPAFGERVLASAWLRPFVVSVAIVGLAIVLMIPAEPAVDVGTRAERHTLYAGFAGDERDGERTFAWVNDTGARLLVPRRSRSDATLSIECRPHLPTASATQNMSVSLNGVVLGTVTLEDGWQTARFDAPSRAWRIGVNELTLSLSSAVSPLEAGTGRDPRRLAVAIDRIVVKRR